MDAMAENPEGFVSKHPKEVILLKERLAELIIQNLVQLVGLCPQPPRVPSRIDGGKALFGL
jgi:hypothetical protein